MATTDAQKKSYKKYSKKCYQYSMRIRADVDPDIVDWIKSKKSAADSIKLLIRADIERQKKSEKN